MSAEAFNRAMLREKVIWKTFSGNNLFLNADDRVERAIIFGLYAGVYLHGHNYLEVIEAEQLQLIIDEYTLNMAQLSAENSKLVIDVAARRYVASIDHQIFAEQMRSKQIRIDAENAKWDSRIAALDADRDALATLRLKTVLAEAQAVNKIKKISAQIINEEYQQAEMDNDALKKELELARVNLRVLQSAIRGLEIQAQINESAYQLYAVDADIAGINAQIASTQAEIARNERSDVEADIERQKNMNFAYEIAEEKQARLDDIDGKESLLESDIEAIADYEDQEGLEQAERLNSLNVAHDVKLKGIELSKEESLFRSAQRIKSHENDVSFALKRKITTEMRDADDIVIIRAQIEAKDDLVRASLNAAETISKANITTSLLHEIGT